MLAFSLLVSLIASFAYVTPAAAEDAAAATTVAATTPAEIAQANPFSDVPANSWAYDAVRQLAAAGLITGYPDNTFKGNRPMTRYEMAVLINRAVNAIQSRMAQQPAGVSPADLAAVRRLVDEFRTELNQVRQQLAALQQQVNANNTATQSALNAIRASQSDLQKSLQTDQAAIRAAQTQLAANKIGIQIVSRPAGASQFVGVAQPFTAIATPATVAVGTAGSPSVFTTGATAGPIWVNLVRLNPGGSFDGGRFQWFTRLESVWRQESQAGNFATTPGYCQGTSLVNVTGGYSCQVSDLSGNSNGVVLASLPIRLAQAWTGYFSPGGFFAKVGRMGYDQGRCVSCVVISAASFDGAQFGYRDRNVQFYVAPHFEGTRASNRAFLNGNYAANLLPSAGSITGNGATFGGGQLCPLGSPYGFTTPTAAGTTAVPGSAPAISVITAPATGTPGTVLSTAGTPANACVGYGDWGLSILGEYYFPSSRTAIGFAFDQIANNIYTGFNPYAGICVSGPNGTTVGTASLAAAPGGSTSGSVWNTSAGPFAGGTAYCPAGTVPLVQGVSNGGGPPVTGAYQTVQAPTSMGSVYVVQNFGPFDKPIFRISLEGGMRLGNDPFSLAAPGATKPTTYRDNKWMMLDLSYASGGNVVNAAQPLYPATGVRNSNVVEVTYLNAGLNTITNDSGVASGSVIPGSVSGSYSGMQFLLAQVAHWFSPNFRAGVYGMVYANHGGLLPTGSAQCPGCGAAIVGRTFGIDTFMVY
jgi:hypothetical protein